MVCNRVANQAKWSMQAMLGRCIMIQNKQNFLQWHYFPVLAALQVFRLSPIIYKHYRATATHWSIYNTSTPWLFPLKMVVFLKNKAFGPLWCFSAVWARLELLDLDVFPALGFGAAVEQEILRSLCMHYIPVPPRAAANKQTFLLVKERKNTLHKVHQQMWPVNPTQPFLLIKKNSMYLQCWCNVTVWWSWISKDLAV